MSLAVLLTAGLLAAVVASLLAVSRPALGIARIGQDEVALDGLLQGGIETAGYLLTEAKVKMADVNGLTLSRSTGTLGIGVADESGLVDLNSAKPELLQGLYAAVNGRSMGAQAFADRVVDWRDQDSDARPLGAEADEYESARLPGRPPNRPFRSVEELRYLLGLSAEDFIRLRSFLTVYTGRGAVDPLSAPEAVLRAIPGLTPNMVQLILQERRHGMSRKQIVQLIQQGSEFLSTDDSSVYRVNVQVRLKNGFAGAVDAVIVGQSGDSSGYKVAAWSRRGAAGGSQ